MIKKVLYYLIPLGHRYYCVGRDQWKWPLPSKGAQGCHHTSLVPTRKEPASQQVKKKFPFQFFSRWRVLKRQFAPLLTHFSTLHSSSCSSFLCSLLSFPLPSPLKQYHRSYLELLKVFLNSTFWYQLFHVP